jgi:hypothetical protein
LLKQAVATIKKGVVGITGKAMPMMPNNKNMNPRMLKKYLGSFIVVIIRPY